MMDKLEDYRVNSCWNDFKEEAKKLGVSLTEEDFSKFNIYIKELNEWNQKINLFRRKNDLEIIAKDFLDSLTVCKHLPTKASLLDIGSGGGFPGIPIKIARHDLRVVLSEVRAKKVFFLRNMVRVLKMENLEIMGRGEKKIEKFDFIVSRAFGSIARFVEAGTPYLKGNGFAISMKGRKGKEELARELPILKKKGWSPFFIEHFKLPILGHDRILIGLSQNVSRETSC